MCVLLASTWLPAIEVSCFPVLRPLSFSNRFYIQKRNSKHSWRTWLEVGQETTWFSVWGEVGESFQEPTQKGGSCAWKKTREHSFWTGWRNGLLRKITSEKLILSLAELAKSQERSDDSSIVNNYYFVIKRQGKCCGPFLKLHFYYRSAHTSWKKFLAPRLLVLYLPLHLVADLCCPVS